MKTNKIKIKMYPSVYILLQTKKNVKKQNNAFASC